MTNSVDKFLKDLEKEKEQALQKMNKHIQGTINAVKESLMLPKSENGTPKITGHLRANWTVSVDQRRSDVVGSKDNIDTSEREQAWAEFLGTPDLYLSNNIYFNNNVDYGVHVNFGTAKIKAQNFKAKAVQAGKEFGGGYK